MGYTILICDDNENICEGLSSYLKEEGQEVLVAYDGETAIEMVKQNHVDAVLLDIMLPGIDGFEVCRRIRKFSDVYIIFLSAKSQEIDRVVGLEIGADDYVVKPFSSREVLVRIKKAMKRVYGGKNKDDGLLSFKDLEVQPDSLRVWVAKEEVSLSPKEVSMLIYFIKNAEKVLTRDHILNAVWGYDYYGDTRVVDVMVKRLRKKVASENAHFAIQSVYGIGYKLVEVLK